MNEVITQRTQLVSSKQIKLSCIVPVHNEQEVIGDFLNSLSHQLEAISNNYEIIVVDDGSTDNTLANILKFQNDHIKLLALSRNFGQENALTAGLEHVTGDVTILIDGDFQHPIDLIPAFVENWAKGYDMVYGIRQNRESESGIKRQLTKYFYHLMAKISKINIPANACYFRLMDKKVVTALNSLQEQSRFMRGLYSWVGFKSIGIPFKVNDRTVGTSSWKFHKRTELAITGIISFSNIPLRVWSLIGFSISLVSFAYGLYIITSTLMFGVDVPGYATIVVTIMFFGGIQLLSIGILGEYIARIFDEVKQRPRYIVAEKYGFDK